MTDALRAATWPVSAAGDALHALARQVEMATRATPYGGSAPGDPLDDVLERAAEAVGVEVEAMEVAHRDVRRLLRLSAPSVVQITMDDGTPGLVAVMRADERGLHLIGPDLARHHVRVEEACAAIGRAAVEDASCDAQQLLEAADIPTDRRARARAALVDERLGSCSVEGWWMIRPPPAESLLGAARRSRLVALAAGVLLGHLAQYAAWIGAWWVVGTASFAGRLDTMAVATWALLLATAVPFQLLESWAQGRFALEAGALLKQRLLAGVLRLDHEAVRTEGTGQLLGRVLDAETVEALGVEGGITAVVAAVEVAGALALLLATPPGLWPGVVLLAWIGTTAAVAWRSYRERARWTRTRLALTHDLVEKLSGHLTRMVQQPRRAWHDEEDPALAEYLAQSRHMDRPGAWLEGLAVRGWLLVASVALAPALLSQTGASPGSLAVAVGGILLAGEALRKLSAGAAQLAGAAIAVQRIRALLAAAGRARSPALSSASSAGAMPGHVPAIEARHVAFRYPRRAGSALSDCTLRVEHGQRILIEGASGSGKSTLGAILSGLRAPQTGVLLVGGVDAHAFGDAGWSSRVAAVPQFHDNHLLTGSLAFNLLLGRGWPPSADDLEAAEEVCVALGLSSLLGRMPAGLMETVGDTGWQLSHGEKSRVYLARALLQHSHVVLLDETFGALDPETLQLCVAATVERAPTVIVIAHP
jgi:ATP-binding cassette subfamily B protein